MVDYNVKWKQLFIFYGTNYCANHKSGEKTVIKAQGEKRMKEMNFNAWICLSEVYVYTLRQRQL